MNELRKQFEDETDKYAFYANNIPTREYLNGFEIIVNDVACTMFVSKQYRFPKRKCNRIKKKYTKMKKNFRMEKNDQRIIQIGDKLIMSSRMLQQLKNLLV